MQNILMLRELSRLITQRKRYYKLRFYLSFNKIPLFRRLFIELQSNCNRDCFFCPRQGDDSGKRIKPNGERTIRSMPTAQAFRIIQQAACLGFKGLVNFHHLSEPFLDPRIIEIAREAKRMGMQPYTNTNGDVLKNDVSLCRQATAVFQRINVGLYDCQSNQEIDAQKKFWQNRLPGTAVTFSLAAQRPWPRAFTPGFEQQRKPWPGAVCLKPLIRLIIHYDGNMAFCCEDMKDEFNLGNAFETGIKELWFSKQHILLIKDLLLGRREKYTLCRNCSSPAPNIKVKPLSLRPENYKNPAIHKDRLL